MFVLHKKGRKKLLTLKSTSNFTLLNTTIFLYVSFFFFFYWKGSVKKWFLLIFHFSWQLQNRFQNRLLKNECIQKFQTPSFCLVSACGESAESAQCFVTWGGCVGSCCRVAALQDSASNAWCSPLWNQQLWTQTLRNNPNERTDFPEN